uniref:Uncharacterized protein n=1 Tax=Arundo donax TaxID=35708 RepID=A0A0A9H999_ARUDO
MLEAARIPIFCEFFNQFPMRIFHRYFFPLRCLEQCVPRILPAGNLPTVSLVPFYFPCSPFISLTLVFSR